MATNADAPFGFRPVANDGGVFNGQTRRCAVVATGTTTALFVGDAVKMDTAAAAAGGYQAVDVVTAGDPIYGVITSFEPSTGDLSKQYRVASTLRYCQVAIADNQLFEVQASGNPGLAAVGLNAAYSKGTGSTVTGMSADEIINATVANTGDFQIVQGVDAPDNDLTLSNSRWIVKVNDPQGKPVRTGT